MKTLRVKEVIKLLESDGYTLKRIQGDHRLFVKPGKRTIPVPGHLNDELGMNTLMSIMRSMKN